MEEALQQISSKYPDISWSQTENSVRVVDRSATAELLKVRIVTLSIKNADDPSDAVAQLWRAPEVQAFIREHGIEPGIWGSTLTSLKGAYPHIVLDLRDFTVAKVMDRIADSYRIDREFGRVWVYQECQSDGHTRVELRVM